MLKSFALFSLTLLLSFSTLGPSFLALFENDVDIEIIQDIEEEKKETEKELEENEKFLSHFPSFSFEIEDNKDLSIHYYLASPYGHIKDINSPPPDYI